MRTEITKSHLNNRICQHCVVKTSTLAPSFYYVFNIPLSCNINKPSFIGNLSWVLLLGNHLKMCIFLKDGDVNASNFVEAVHKSNDILYTKEMVEILPY